MRRSIVAMIAGAVLVMSAAGCTGSSGGGSTGEHATQPASESPSTSAAQTTPATPATAATVDDSVREYVLPNDHSASSQVVTVQEDSNISDADVASAKVLVQGSQVAVYVCGTQDAAAIVVQTCDGAFDTFRIDDSQGEEVWTGTRDGSTAVVSGSNPFFWGTVTFDGDGPAAAATVFTVASGCVDVNGNQGFHDPDQSGLCLLP